MLRLQIKQRKDFMLYWAERFSAAVLQLWGMHYQIRVLVHIVVLGSWSICLIRMTCVKIYRYLSSNAYAFQTSQESPSIMSLEAKLDDQYANHSKEMKRLEHLEKLRKERESRVIAMPELDEDHLVVCVNHPKAGMFQRSTDLFQNIYDWVGSHYHLPEYFELCKVTGEIIFPSESVLKVEKCVLYMQERDYPLSLHENDSTIEYRSSTKVGAIYEEIEASRAKKFHNLNTTKRTMLLNRQNVFGKLMYLYGKDRNLLSYQIRGFISRWIRCRWWGSKGNLFHFYRTLVATGLWRKRRIFTNHSCRALWRRIWCSGKNTVPFFYKFCPLSGLILWGLPAECFYWSIPWSIRS